MNWNLKLIQTFVLVAKERSFSKAANTSGRTQPAISNQIKDLEKQIGFSLFDRSSRAVRLTAEGEALLEGAERAIGELSIGFMNAKRVADKRQENLRIACLPTLSAGYLPDILETANDRLPQVNILVRELNNEDLLEAVRSHEVDFGIGVKVPADDCHVKMLGTDKMVAIVSEKNPYFGASVVSMEDILDFPILVLPQATPTVLAFESVSVRTNKKVEVVHRFAQPETLVAMALKNVGIAILPLSYVARKQDTEHIVQLTSPGLERQLALIWSKSRIASTAALKVAEICTSTILINH